MRWISNAVVLAATVMMVQAQGYSCDGNACQLAHNCLCASKNPPAGLNPKETPQFVVVTFDDSVQDSLMATAKKMLNVTNPNGCKAKGTWYVSMEYTDFSLVQQWYVDGHEVADHTFSHVGNPPSEEIAAAKSMLHTYAGIPNNKIVGFRAPFLNYSQDTFKHLSEQQFTYDSSASAVGDDDLYWPYTLDYGLANLNDATGGSSASVRIPGLWEFPMYSVANNAGIPQLMDVYLAGPPSDVKSWSLTTFDKHYNGSRQPFGIYVHPTHLTPNAAADPAAQLNGMLELIKTIAEKPDVWFVTNYQLLQWMKNPVKVSELGKQAYMKCQQPTIPQEICNGLDDDSNGTPDDNLLNNCNFGTTNFKTCFNCPATAPSPSNPTPNPSTQNGSAGYRYPVPDTCDTVWWDPVGNKCLCDLSSNSCPYKDLATVSPGGKSSDASNLVHFSVSHLGLSMILVALVTLY
ncbi:hypothetical protein DM01DRAFT_1333603 [Hesseltinella vesiculosa]|uniref:NodB homology domain-containing protein n=1 Tax=Hesseltinella vesiculosa TaxID=101127 RepID=A0A1X2GQK9_9FUNG|nr:hypothetical protein DM01DRAFT_1333603 [Hesseltinella vesiculosa]